MTKLCDNCEHKDVCKYCSIYEELSDRLVALNFGGKYSETFSAKLNCNKYSMEPSKLTETYLKLTDKTLCTSGQPAINFKDDLDE